MLHKCLSIAHRTRPHLFKAFVVECGLYGKHPSKELRFPWQQDSEGIRTRPVSHGFHNVIAGDEAVRAGSVSIHMSLHTFAQLALHGERALDLPETDSSHNDSTTNIDDVVFRDLTTLQNHTR